MYSYGLWPRTSSQNCYYVFWVIDTLLGKGKIDWYVEISIKGKHSTRKWAYLPTVGATSVQLWYLEFSISRLISDGSGHLTISWWRRICTSWFHRDIDTFFKQILCKLKSSVLKMKPNLFYNIGLYIYICQHTIQQSLIIISGGYYWT